MVRRKTTGERTAKALGKALDAAGERVERTKAKLETIAERGAKRAGRKLAKAKKLAGKQLATAEKSARRGVATAKAKGGKRLTAAQKAADRKLAAVRLTVERARIKFKLGQNRPAETRRKIVQFLHERGRPNDTRAAEALESTLP